MLLPRSVVSVTMRLDQRLAEPDAQHRLIKPSSAASERLQRSPSNPHEQGDCGLGYGPRARFGYARVCVDIRELSDPSREGTAVPAIPRDGQPVSNQSLG